MTKVNVPDVMNKSKQDAEADCRHAGLNPVVIEMSKGGVMKVQMQFPGAGDLVEDGTSVYLVISPPLVTVPNIYFLPVGINGLNPSALLECLEFGLVLYTMHVDAMADGYLPADPNDLQNSVKIQTPDAGMKIPIGGSVYAITHRRRND